MTDNAKMIAVPNQFGEKVLKKNGEGITADTALLAVEKNLSELREKYVPWATKHLDKIREKTKLLMISANQDNFEDFCVIQENIRELAYDIECTAGTMGHDLLSEAASLLCKFLNKCLVDNPRALPRSFSEGVFVHVETMTLLESQAKIRSNELKGTAQEQVDLLFEGLKQIHKKHGIK